jgi:N-formylglutamate deformylase
MNLIVEEIKNSFVFHIPHSSIDIPDLTGFNKDDPALIENEILKMTDWETDKIFNIPGTT